MWVELFEHTTYGILHELSLIHIIHIQIADGQFGYLQFSQGTVVPEIQFHLCHD